MRTSALALLGLVAFAQAMPAMTTAVDSGLAKRGDEDMSSILDEWISITTIRYSESYPPPLPIYMIACQLAELLDIHGVHVDVTILGVWSTFEISNKVKRQDGIFALPGSCSVEDIIGLETILASLLLIYGSNPPAHIVSLRNAVTAALVFCGVADPTVGALEPDVPTEGGEIVPDQPVEGGAIVPDQPVGPTV